MRGGAGGRTPPLVLHVIPTGAARGGQREAQALRRRLDAPGVRDHRLLSLFTGPDEIPVDVALGHPGGARPAVGFDPRVVLRLRRTLASLDPAVVVAHGGDPLKYLVPALAGSGRPLAYYATGTFEHAGRRARVALWRALLGRAAVVACEGEEVLAQCRTLLGVPTDRSLLAPNGRDPAVFRPATAGDAGAAAGGTGVGSGDEGDGPVLAFVGALTTGKRPDRFIEAVAELRRRGVAVRAWVCGDGPLAPTLVAPAAAAGVELLGTRHDIPELLRGADAFVFTSRPTGEGMPGVLIEAGLSGLPVVATAVPGVRTIVADGVTGVVVEPEDRAGLVEAMARLVADPDGRAAMGRAARERCTARFSLDAVAACWLGFLEPLVAGAVSRSGRSGPGSRPGPGA